MRIRRTVRCVVQTAQCFPRRLLLAGGLLLSAMILSGCGGGDEAAGQPPGRPPSLVRVAPLQQQQVSRKISVVGSVTPVRTSIVASGSDGVVEKFETEEGQEIEKGQYVAEKTVLSVLRMESTNNALAEAQAVLVERKHKLDAATEIHPKEMAHAEAMVKMADAVKKNAQARWERTQSLHARGVATETELDDAQEKWEAAEQSWIAAEENLAQVKAGLKIEQAKASYDAQVAHVAFLESEKVKRTTRAPFEGYIVDEHTYVGQWLSKGDPVVTLARMNEVDVVVHVDESDIRYVGLGQNVDVDVQGTGRSDWPGRVVHIVPRSDWERGSRAFPVVVRIPNTFEDVEVTGDGETTHRKMPILKAGMMARVTIRGPEVETLLAHKDSLVRTTRGTYVFVFDPQDSSAKFDPNNPTMGSVRQIPVETDLHMSVGEFIGIRLLEEETAATDNPLQPGAWVVTEGGERFAAPVQDNVNALSQIPK